MYLKYFIIIIHCFLINIKKMWAIGRVRNRECEQKFQEQLYRWAIVAVGSIYSLWAVIRGRSYDCGQFFVSSRLRAIVLLAEVRAPYFL